MGEYKDKNGKTRVGTFLANLGEGAAPLAKLGLNVAAGLTGVKQLEDLANKIKTSDQIAEVDKSLALELLKLDLEEAKEITKRWVSDNTTEGWLPKNIRPVTLAFMLILLLLFMILDSMDIAFDIKDQWIDLFKALSISVFVAYFGSRGYEKVKGH